VNAALDRLDADIAACRLDLEDTSFRTLSEKERRNALRVEIANLIPGTPIPEPDLGPPSQKSIRMKSALFTTLRRLERAAIALRNI
jgi:hypothetical protein